MTNALRLHPLVSQHVWPLLKTYWIALFIFFPIESSNTYYKITILVPLVAQILYTDWGDISALISGRELGHALHLSCVATHFFQADFDDEQQHNFENSMPLQ